MQESKTAFQQLILDTKSKIQEVEMNQIKAMIDNKNIDGIIVDVREKEEFVKGYIPNSIHLSKGMIEVNIEKVIPNNKDKIYLYCGGGSRSSLAALNIQKMGYTNVFSVSGGFKKWVDLLTSKND